MCSHGTRRFVEWQCHRPDDEAVQIIRESRGGHFEPDVVHAFVAIEGTCRAIAPRYADSEAAVQAKADSAAAP